MKKRFFTAFLLMMADGAVAATPVQVTRFHLGMPIERRAVSVVAGPGVDAAGLETKRYADAVREQLQRLGFADDIAGAAPPLSATVSFSRVIREAEPAQRPITIGIGGGGFGGGVGGGASASFGVGKRQSRAIYVTQLSVQLRDQASGTVIWEGRAQSESRAGAAKTDDAPAKLAEALFRGFPGESGRTITVK
ncbi:MAG: DUF4136 domain-containing protein [Sphingomonas sp.]